jgi:HK97 family phage major capsid protein
MLNLSALREQRSAKADAIRAIIAKATAENRDLNEQEQSAFDAGKGEVEKLERDIKNAEFLANLERRMDGEKIIVGTGDGKLDTELRSFSLRKAILATVPGHSEDCRREVELSNELARRAGRQFSGMAVPMSALYEPVEKRVVSNSLTDGGGGDLIATDHMGGMYIDKLREALVIRQLGALTLSGLVGNVSIPKLTTGATAGWVAENTALTPSDQNYESVTLTPKHVGGIVPFSRNMLLQSSPAIETLIRNDFAKLLAAAVDKAAINGGGSNEPTGIIATTAVNHDTSFATPSWSAVLELIEAVEAADSAGTAFCTNAPVIRALRSTLRADSTDSQMVMEAPRTLAGYPVAMTSLVPSQAIVFGNWADLLLGFWSELDILPNPYGDGFDKGGVDVRAMCTCDVALRYSESFAYADDVSTTA